MTRSFSSGCENANWKPDCRLGSKLLIGLFVVVRDVSHDRLHVPAPHGRRCRRPVDENQSSISTAPSPNSRFAAGVAALVRPNWVEKTGANAPRLSPTRAASASVS